VDRSSGVGVGRASSFEQQQHVSVTGTHDTEPSRVVQTLSVEIDDGCASREPEVAIGEVWPADVGALYHFHTAVIRLPASNSPDQLRPLAKIL
jgi:hypothetical protein